MRIAITRGVSPDIGQCELTHLDREPIDLQVAVEQHRQYENCLAELGCSLVRLPAEPEYPDSVFVEDAAVVFDELAIITRPGALSRRGETVSIAAALEPYRRLVSIEDPGTVDGGDVMVLGRSVFVGMSERTNRSGVDQMASALEPLGYRVTGVALSGCLHLKSAVCPVGPDTLLLNREWVDPGNFGGARLIDVDPTEPGAACSLLIGDRVVFPAEFTATRASLEAEGVSTVPVPMSEMAKAEAGVTCCSLVFNA